MTAADLLSRAKNAGLTLWRHGDRLRYRGPSEAVKALLPDLRAHKPELLTVLGSPHPARPGASSDELTRLVREFAAFSGFSEKDTEEALQTALADPESALRCYRALVAELPTDPRSGARRTRVLEMLAANPTVRYAAVTDLDALPGVVVLTIGVRGSASFDLHVPADKWDGVLFLDLLEKHCGTLQ